MYELEENVKTFIETKVNSGDYTIKDFRVFVGEELYVEKAYQQTRITLNLKYRGMS
jgi:transcription antitermination factor NusG